MESCLLSYAVNINFVYVSDDGRKKIETFSNPFTSNGWITSDLKNVRSMTNFRTSITSCVSCC